MALPVDFAREVGREVRRELEEVFDWEEEGSTWGAASRAAPVPSGVAGTCRRAKTEEHSVPSTAGACTPKTSMRTATPSAARAKGAHDRAPAAARARSLRGAD
jgi:hypothetical protein